MELKMFTIYDTKTQAYNQPFYAPTPGAAIRIFTETAKDPASMINKYPHDFLLFEIGEFDDQTCQIGTHEPHALGSAADYLLVAENLGDDL